jgi:hypothetical protein
MNHSEVTRLRRNSWFRTCLPYHYVPLKAAPGAKHIYLPVNRSYKPLGIRSREWVDYEDFRAQAVVFATDPHKFDGIWSDRKSLYLYNDNNAILSDYFDRLERLMIHSVKMT